jgi:hypothetical protein
MVSVFAWSAVDRGFESRSGQAKDYNWLARDKDNVSRVGRHVYPRTAA